MTKIEVRLSGKARRDFERAAQLQELLPVLEAKRNEALQALVCIRAAMQPKEGE